MIKEKLEKLAIEQKNKEEKEKKKRLLEQKKIVKEQKEAKKEEKKINQNEDIPKFVYEEDEIVKSRAKKRDREFTFLIDRSISMKEYEEDVTKDFRFLMKNLKKSNLYENFNTKVNLVLFDEELHFVVEEGSVSQIMNFEYKADGVGTRIYDAVLKNINRQENKQNKSKQIFAIISDGEDNKYSPSKAHPSIVKEAIETKKETGWSFVFLAVNKKAHKVADDLGFDLNDRINIDFDNYSSENNWTKLLEQKIELLDLKEEKENKNKR